MQKHTPIYCPKCKNNMGFYESKGQDIFSCPICGTTIVLQEQGEDEDLEKARIYILKKEYESVGQSLIFYRIITVILAVFLGYQGYKCYQYGLVIDDYLALCFYPIILFMVFSLCNLGVSYKFHHLKRRYEKEKKNNSSF